MIATQPTLDSFEILLAFENWAQVDQGASVYASSTADGIGEDFVDHTVDKLLTPELDTAWRSGSIAGVSIDPLSGGVVRVTFDLGEPRLVNWVSIHRHNVRVPWRSGLYANDPAFAATPLSLSAWTDPVVRPALEDYDYDEFDFYLGPRPRTLASLTQRFRLDSFVTFDRLYGGVRYVTMEFDVSSGSNLGTDYLQIAYPMVARYFRPEINVKLGWAFAPADRAVTNRVESGAKRGRKKTVGNVINFSLGYLENEEAFRRILSEWLKEKGTLGLAFVWVEPEKRWLFYDMAVLGQLASLPPVTMALLDWPDASGFSLEEAE